jgi:hypothetical protein
MRWFFILCSRGRSFIRTSLIYPVVGYNTLSYGVGFSKNGMCRMPAQIHLFIKTVIRSKTTSSRPKAPRHVPILYEWSLERVWSEVCVSFYMTRYWCMDMETHVKHFTTVLAWLKEHNFYAKERLCDFGMVRVEYLGHAISGQGLSTGAMLNWPRC